MQFPLCFTKPIDEVENVRLIQPMSFGQFIFFGKGSFDDWAAYTGVLCQDGRVWCALPLDKYYFEIAALLAQYHGTDKVYLDVLHLFEQTGKAPERSVVDCIFRMSLGYGHNQPWAYNMFMHLYYGMIAEENKAGTLLGRSIKMNGIHSLLKGGRDIVTAADECRSKPWTEIRDECLSRQIYRESP